VRSLSLFLKSRHIYSFSDAPLPLRAGEEFVCGLRRRMSFSRKNEREGRNQEKNNTNT